MELEVVEDVRGRLEDVAVPGTNKISQASPIALPMASHKLIKKITNLIKSTLEIDPKALIRSGLKDVQSSLRKNEKGIVVFAGDVTPIEIMCHLPAVCEELDVPYCYVPDKETLGNAMGVKRGSLMVLIKKHAKNKALYDDVAERINNLPPPW
ncbi:hypothetical protein L9F63_013992 [Diploptera punctata]|uniref:Ribosomal protein eL8/eL30/eS12/Gadd45 domain-containing protein n=1 Tax=Diploptera punctata TaxID=6984 RepID=A0AAD8ELJ0_DIPPU|nr:hypothetical protein L9F63_013992 [Diploptera punctata]